MRMVGLESMVKGEPAMGVRGRCGARIGSATATEEKKR